MKGVGRQVVIVTGAAARIGQEYVRALAAAGASRWRRT